MKENKANETHLKDGAEINCGCDMLHCIKKNTEMAKKSIEVLIKKLDEGSFRSLLLSHYESYDDFSNRITGAITACGETPKSRNAFSDAMLWSSINLNTLMDNSYSHIADMLIEGNNMGITTITKELNACGDQLDGEIRALAVDLMQLEQMHIEELKPYL
ncbi:MAG: hypothetical protein IJF71_03605 [Clostridia bacterium]|nr:hypothetical protein [Clostridia bacterium]